jgi:hypothetical protein
MGAECSCVCSQPLDGKSPEEAMALRRPKHDINSIMPNITIDSDESIILDPVEVLPKSLIRRYLINRFFAAIPLFKSFLSPGVVVYAPPDTDPDIEKLEKSMPLFEPKRITGPTIKNFSTVYLSDGGCYSGQWDVTQQRPEGFGIMVYVNNSKYFGEFKSGKRSGKGRFITIEGDIYEGDFYNDKLQGFGKMKKSDGTLYEGEYLNNMQHGEGTLKHMGEIIYKGGFLRGMKHGKGFLSVGGNTYEGEFTSDLMDGEGNYVWKNKNSYHGGWKMNKMHGKGVYKWNDGREYSGHYVEGIREGIGSLKWPDGREYRGGWKANKMHGEGTYIYMDKGKKRNFVALYECGKRKKVLRY